MFVDPNLLSTDLDRLEGIEKASLRFVVHSLDLFRKEAVEIFQNERDLQADIGEDITGEAQQQRTVSGEPDRMLRRGERGFAPG